MKFGNFFFFLFSVLADASFSSTVLNFSKKKYRIQKLFNYTLR